MLLIPPLPFSPILLPTCPWFTLRMYDSGLFSTRWWIHSFLCHVLPVWVTAQCQVMCPLSHCIKALTSEVQVFIRQLWVHNCQNSPDQRIHQPSNLAIITHGFTWVSFTSSNSIRSSLRAEVNYSLTSTTMPCTIMNTHIYQTFVDWLTNWPMCNKVSLGVDKAVFKLVNRAWKDIKPKSDCWSLITRYKQAHLHLHHCKLEKTFHL